jgi:hypothetical protein
VPLRHELARGKGHFQQVGVLGDAGGLAAALVHLVPQGLHPPAGLAEGTGLIAHGRGLVVAAVAFGDAVRICRAHLGHVVENQHGRHLFGAGAGLLNSQQIAELSGPQRVLGHGFRTEVESLPPPAGLQAQLPHFENEIRQPFF